MSREAFDAYHEFADRTLGVRRRVPARDLRAGVTFANGETLLAATPVLDFLRRPAIALDIQTHAGTSYRRVVPPTERWAVGA